MQHTRRARCTIHTTLGELASAYYEAAVAELRDPVAAAQLAREMVQEAVRQRRVALV